MRKILASIVIALLLTSCLLQFDPDYIPYNTIVHRPLRAGVYEAYTDDTHYELTIAEGDHDSIQGVSCTLKLYRCNAYINAYICEAEPYVTYKGTYRHYITEYEPIAGSTWDKMYHVDELVFEESSAPDCFPPRDHSGTFELTYDYWSAGKEQPNSSYRQALFPRINTKVYMNKRTLIHRTIEKYAWNGLSQAVSCIFGGFLRQTVPFLHRFQVYPGEQPPCSGIDHAEILADLGCFLFIISTVYCIMGLYK